jgi:hypothetical protein
MLMCWIFWLIIIFGLLFWYCLFFFIFNDRKQINLIQKFNIWPIFLTASNFIVGKSPICSLIARNPIAISFT